MNYQDLIRPLCELARNAGEEIVRIYQREYFDEQLKSDNSPLTEADLASHKIIEAGLQQLTPTLPVLSEESDSISYNTRKEWQTYWLVDPLDGTKEFIARNGEFTVNISLIHEHRPVIGVIYIPLLDTLYYAAKQCGAFKKEVDLAELEIKVRRVPVIKGKKHYTVVASRRHGFDKVQRLCEKMASFDLINRGSSLKMCLVAEGAADCYPRFGPTSEWDTAAAQVIVEEAGGKLVKTDFSPLEYNTRADLLNPDFLVLGDPDEDWTLLL